MTDQEEREFLESVQRRIPSWATAVGIIAVILLALAMLLLPLIISANEWRGHQLGCVPREPVAERYTVNTDTKEADANRALTPAQTLVARQTVYISMTVRRKDGKVRSMHGNGFVYDDGLVVTAEHVVSNHNEDGARIRVHCNGRNVFAKVLRTNATLDIALLSAPRCHGERLELSDVPLKEGEQVMAVGYTFYKADEASNLLKGYPLSPGSSYELAIRYASVRTADPTSILLPENVPDNPLWDSEIRVAKQKIVRNLTEIERLRLPRYQAVKGLAIPGHSGSLLIRPNGTIVGMCIIRFTVYNRTFITPSSAILLVLRDEGIDYPRP